MITQQNWRVKLVRASAKGAKSLTVTLDISSADNTAQGIEHAVKSLPELVSAAFNLEAVASLINARQRADAVIRPDDWSELAHCCNRARAAIEQTNGH